MMKEEALKLADELKSLIQHYANCASVYRTVRFENRNPDTAIDNFNQAEKDLNAGFKLLDDMIRKLVAELDRVEDIRNYYAEEQGRFSKSVDDKQGEPVAWTDDLWTIHLNDEYCMLDEDMKKGMIPLYTAPQNKIDRITELEAENLRLQQENHNLWEQLND